MAGKPAILCHVDAFKLGWLVGDLLFYALVLSPLFIGIRLLRPRSTTAPGQPGRLAPKTRRRLGIALIVLGAVVFLLALYMTNVKPKSSKSADPIELSVGECITHAQFATRDLKSGAVACGTTQSMYRLASRGPASSSCPDGERKETTYSALENKSTLYCFTFDMAEGECFAKTSNDNSTRVVACADPTAYVKVDSIIEGKNDLSVCPNGPRGVAYPEPQLVICTVKP